jgi:hypothetical protein
MSACIYFSPDDLNLTPDNFHHPQQIRLVQYTIPDYVHISMECRQLLARIFVANPTKVIIPTCKS